MSIDISKEAGGASANTNGSRSNSASFYETRTLMCKSQCGYYGNSMQYEGYCSICYRKLKSQRQQQQQQQNSHGYLNSSISSSTSFDDSSSLLSDERKSNSKDHQIWNDHSNLKKFVPKKEKRTSNAFKTFLRRPSSSTIVDTVAKVADKAANIVDHSFNSSLNNSINENSLTHSSSASSTSLSSSGSFLSSSQSFMASLNLQSHDASNLLEFKNVVHRLLSSPNSPSSSSSASKTLNETQFSQLLLPKSKPNNQNNTKETTESNHSRLTLIKFEELFRLNFPQLYQDLIKRMKLYVDELKKKDAQLSNGLKLSEDVQEFYKRINKYVLNNASIKVYLDKLAATHVKTAKSENSSFAAQSEVGHSGNSGDDAEKLYEAIMIMVESFITNNIYDCVFPAIMSEFEEQDMNLQNRIRSFYWITNEMIGTCIDENSIFYRETYEEALNYIVEMDAKRTTHEKMLCITECSKNIYKAIHISANISRNRSETSSTATSPTNSAENSEQSFEQATQKSVSKTIASADDYLPAFIYIVLKANPTMLYSNMNFISRFAFEKRILQGEHAYHFCSLNAIITHVENLNAHHLNMSEEQFENYCNGLVDVNSSSNVLKLIHSNLKILSELKDKQKLLKQEMSRLQSDMESFKQSMQKSFHSCLDKNKEKYTHKINGYERKSVLDDNHDVLLSKLPQPLKPSLVEASAFNSLSSENNRN